MHLISLDMFGNRLLVQRYRDFPREPRVIALEGFPAAYVDEHMTP